MDPKLIALSAKLACEATPEQLSARVQLLLEEKRGLETQIAAIAKLLGVEADSTAIIEKAKQFVADARTLAEVLPELEQVASDEAEEEDKAAKDDVEMTMRARNLPEEVRPVLAHQRTAHIAIPRDLQGRPDVRGADKRGTEMRKALAQRRQLRREFRACYGLGAGAVPPGQPGPSVAHLTQAVATPAPGGPGTGGRYASPLLAGMTFGARGEPILGAAPAPAVVPAPGIGAGPGGKLDLTRHPGRNDHERAIAYLKAQPGNEGDSFEALHIKASVLLEQQGAA